jgi:hypothetical protein
MLLRGPEEALSSFPKQMTTPSSLSTLRTDFETLRTCLEKERESSTASQTEWGKEIFQIDPRSCKKIREVKTLERSLQVPKHIRIKEKPLN